MTTVRVEDEEPKCPLFWPLTPRPEGHCRRPVDGRLPVCPCDGDERRCPYDAREVPDDGA